MYIGLEMKGWVNRGFLQIWPKNVRIKNLFWIAGSTAWWCSPSLDIACTEHEDCIQKAQERFNRWRQEPDNVNIVPPNLRSVVYCTAVSYGGEDVWNFLWERYKAAQVASEKDKFMYALACAREPWLLTRYLNWSLTSDSGIRRQDGSYVFRSVGAKLYGRDLTFNYVRDKWDAIFKR
ncbi:aminopeptidase Ey [Trichonephila inaurata madagascariensis]|uniref:Aminopeptidase Ey n=1 Tax=Trichonephila inaurata madagascariensis TaxID=2747483 RepID=A0A8X6XHS0_9ARAC|nr:aminopeptidase Ey [Trichonephila inaurata madagascariensis]